jgi:hypothetical protein
LIIQKLVLSAQQKQQAKTHNALYDRLYNKPFWIWSKEEHKQEDKRTNGDCCFNHIIGLPQKNGVDQPLFDYEKLKTMDRIQIIRGGGHFATTSASTTPPMLAKAS